MLLTKSKSSFVWYTTAAPTLSLVATYVDH